MDLKAPGWVSEFRSFIMRGNVVDLAVGIIIGAALDRKSTRLNSSHGIGSRMPSSA